MEFPKKTNINLFLILFSLGITACSPQLKDDQTLVRINDMSITVRDYRAALNGLKPEESSWSRKEQLQVRNTLLKSLIRRAVLLSEVKRKNISVSDDDIEMAVQDYKANYKPGTFDQILLDDKISPEDWRQKVQEDLLIKKLVASLGFKPSRPPLRDALLFYEKNSSKYKTPETIEALQIVVSEQSKANELAAKLKSSPNSFTELAKEYSSAWTEKDRDTVFLSKGVIPEEISSIVFSAPPAKILGPLDLGNIFVFLKIKKKHPSLNKDFETVRPDIEKLLVKEQEDVFLENYQDSILRSANIDYNRKLISALR